MSCIFRIKESSDFFTATETKIADFIIDNKDKIIHWSAQELADAIFVSRTTIANYECGRRIPDIETLKAIAKVLKVSISDLTDEQMDINLIRNEIFNTNVLNKSKHRSLSAHIMNIILTIALVISMATILIPVIRNSHFNNNIKNLKNILIINAN
jgi:transcriptional regulator with XRE-family HTH domain